MRRDAVAKAVDRTPACSRNHFDKCLWLGGELLQRRHRPHRRHRLNTNRNSRPPRRQLRLRRRPPPRPRVRQPPSIEDPHPIYRSCTPAMFLLGSISPLSNTLCIDVRDSRSVNGMLVSVGLTVVGEAHACIASARPPGLAVRFARIGKALEARRGIAAQLLPLAHMQTPVLSWRIRPSVECVHACSAPSPS